MKHVLLATLFTLFTATPAWAEESSPPNEHSRIDPAVVCDINTVNQYEQTVYVNVWFMDEVVNFAVEHRNLYDSTQLSLNSEHIPSLTETPQQHDTLNAYIAGLNLARSEEDLMLEGMEIVQIALHSRKDTRTITNEQSIDDVSIEDLRQECIYTTKLVRGYKDKLSMLWATNREMLAPLRTAYEQAYPEPKAEEQERPGPENRRR